MGQRNLVHDEEKLRRQLNSCRTRRGRKRQGYIHQKSLRELDRSIRVFGTDPRSVGLPTDERLEKAGGKWPQRICEFWHEACTMTKGGWSDELIIYCAASDLEFADHGLVAIGFRFVRVRVY